VAGSDADDSDDRDDGAARSEVEDRDSEVGGS
jgi:hypothetical protein